MELYLRGEKDYFILDKINKISQMCSAGSSRGSSHKKLSEVRILSFNSQGAVSVKPATAPLLQGLGGDQEAGFSLQALQTPPFLSCNCTMF